MYVCIYIYIYIYMCVYIYIYIYIYIHIHTYTYIYIHTHYDLRDGTATAGGGLPGWRGGLLITYDIVLYIVFFLKTVCTVYTHIYIYIYICVCVYIYIYIHTITIYTLRAWRTSVRRRPPGPSRCAISMVAIFYAFSLFCEIVISLLSLQNRQEQSSTYFRGGKRDCRRRD